jgi:hypothetical protein
MCCDNFSPRVAAVRQPWAVMQNPLGIVSNASFAKGERSLYGPEQCDFRHGRRHTAFPRQRLGGAAAAIPARRMGKRRSFCNMGRRDVRRERISAAESRLFLIPLSSNMSKRTRSGRGPAIPPVISPKSPPWIFYGNILSNGAPHSRFFIAWSYRETLPSGCPN